MILFYTLCKAASHNLDRVKEKTRNLASQKSPNVVKHNVNQLKDHYFKYNEFIHQINRRFGIILLLEISCTFFQIIVQIVVTVVGIKNQKHWSFHATTVFISFIYITNITIIISISEKLSRKVLFHQSTLVLLNLFFIFIWCFKRHLRYYGNSSSYRAAVRQ